MLFFLCGDARDQRSYEIGNDSKLYDISHKIFLSLFCHFLSIHSPVHYIFSFLLFTHCERGREFFFLEWERFQCFRTHRRMNCNWIWSAVSLNRKCANNVRATQNLFSCGVHGEKKRSSSIYTHGMGRRREPQNSPLSEMCCAR